MDKKWLIIVFLAVLSIGFFTGRSGRKAERALSEWNLKAARDSVSTYRITIDGLEQTVSEKSALILTKEQAIATGLVEIDRLKAIHMKEIVTNARLKGEIRVLKDSLSLPPETEIVYVQVSGDKKPAVVLPFEWTYEDKFISLTTGIKLDTKPYFDLSVPFQGEISVGYVKSGFMKTEPKGVFTTENEYIEIDEMNVVIIQEEKAWWQKTWVHILSGAIIAETIHQIIKDK